VKPAICFEMLYPNESPEGKINRIADNGFHYVEFWSWKDKNLDAIAEAAKGKGVGIVNFSGQRAGDLIDASTHPVLLRDIEDSIPTARKLGVRTLMVLTNELGEGGRVLHPCAHIPDEEKRRNVVAGLRMIMRSVPDDFLIVLEPLNTVLDHVGYYLASMASAVEIVEEVADPRLRVLCDFYHLALMGEDPVEIVRRYSHLIGYVHVADFPGRHEPGTGRGKWSDVLAELGKNNYQGYVGFEFSPAGDSDASLSAIRGLWDSVFGPGGEI